MTRTDIIALVAAVVTALIGIVLGYFAVGLLAAIVAAIVIGGVGRLTALAADGSSPSPQGRGWRVAGMILVTLGLLGSLLLLVAGDLAVTLPLALAGLLSTAITATPYFGLAAATKQSADLRRRIESIESIETARKERERSEGAVLPLQAPPTTRPSPTPVERWAPPPPPPA